MIRFFRKERVSDPEFCSDRCANLDEIAKATGIHRTTLCKIASKKGCNCATDNLDKPCGFFGCRIEELAEHLPEERDA